MSVKTLSGELEQEYWHAVNRVVDRIESLGLDLEADEVQVEVAAWFGPDFVTDMVDGE